MILSSKSPEPRGIRGKYTLNILERQPSYPRPHLRLPLGNGRGRSSDCIKVVKSQRYFDYYDLLPPFPGSSEERNVEVGILSRTVLCSTYEDANETNSARARQAIYVEDNSHTYDDGPILR